MAKVYSVKGGSVLFLAALAAAGTIAAYLTVNASADGRTLNATFCTGLCIQVASQNGQASGTMGVDESRRLDLQPGTYWLTVNDNSAGHDFVLRSCPGAAVYCDASQATADNVDPLTGVAEQKTVTIKINLSHGTYRLYCDAPLRSGGTHESMGMYVDLVVGGVGQVGAIPTTT